MVLRKFVERLTKPIEDLDHEELTEFCSSLGLTPMGEIEPRSQVRVVGEVRSVRIVPRAGADALEATIHDGSGKLTAVFLGRRKIPGISPGRRLVLEGVVAREHGYNNVYNPLYTLL